MNHIKGYKFGERAENEFSALYYEEVDSLEVADIIIVDGEDGVVEFRKLAPSCRGMEYSLKFVTNGGIYLRLPGMGFMQRSDINYIMEIYGSFYEDIIDLVEECWGF